MTGPDVYGGTHGQADLRAPESLRRGRRERPAHHDLHPAARPRPRRPQGRRTSAPDAGRDERGHLQHHDRQAEAPVRGEARTRLLLRRQGARPLPGQRLYAEGGRGRGLPALPAVDVELRPAGHPPAHPAALLPAAGPRPRHRADRLRQVDDAGLHDRAHQLGAPGPHCHHRGPHRILPVAAQGHHQPARALRRHHVLWQRPPLGPPRGPGRRSHRRDARLRDGRGGLACRRNGPSDFLHPAHELGRRIDQPHHRHLPQPVPDPDPDHAVDVARGRHHPGPPAARRRQGARPGHGDHDPQSGHPQPHPREQDPPDLLIHADGPGEVRDADLQPVPGQPVLPQAGQPRHDHEHELLSRRADRYHPTPRGHQGCSQTANRKCPENRGRPHRAR